MKKLALGLCFCSLIAIGGPIDQEPTTMNGSFHWTARDYKGDIRAVFTPAGEGKWAVAFYFEFSNSDHVYEGTAEGSLDNGDLKGSVKNDSKKRSFTFVGACANGTFTGTHEEIGRKGPRDTGTIELTRATGK